jgi:hypothetical protein
MLHSGVQERFRGATAAPAPALPIETLLAALDPAVGHSTAFANVKSMQPRTRLRRVDTRRR